MNINQADIRDLLFRVFFSLIFIGLGGEHVFSDSLLQDLMPTWMPEPRLVSIACGIWLLVWGSCIALGWQIRFAALALILFLVAVTAAVHLPGVLVTPTQIGSECERLWEILQRSNLAKNVCLLGVCFYLLDYRAGRFSVDGRRGRDGN